MKKIYFVRHGQSTANVDGIRRGAETELTNTGKKQVEILAKRFENIDIDIVLSSPYKRALDTGRKIAETKKVPLVEIEYARERELPKEVLGKHKKDPGVVKLVTEIFDSWISGNNKHKQAENYTEILNRADKLRIAIEQMQENNIAVTSHSMFGKFFALRVILGEHMNPEQTLYSLFHMKTSNTGITVYEIDEKNDWKLVNWNDDAHLGELNN